MQEPKKYIYSKEKIKTYSENFYKKNAEKLKEKQKCEICGGSFNYANKWHHQQTNKHQNALNNIVQEKKDVQFVEAIKKLYTPDQIKLLFNV